VNGPSFYTHIGRRGGNSLISARPRLSISPRYWAGLEGRQRQLKLALFETYFTNCLNPSDRDVLADAAEKAGLDRQAAAEVLSSDCFVTEVREEEGVWRARGINSVPAIIINNRYLISGGQPPELFEQAIRKIASEMPETAVAD